MADESSVQEANTSEATGGSSESTVEVNVKTLDSQIYTFRIEKNMSVLLLKEKIADRIGVPVGQQRLIFRGKVLKDEHCLSEYYVEDGHTLHLVARQPVSSTGSTSGQANTNNDTQGNDTSAAAPHNRVGQVSHSVVLGTFNIGDQSESAVPDLSRIVGAVLNSIGLGNQMQVGGATNISSTASASQSAETEGSRGNFGGRGEQIFPNQSFQSAPQSMQFPLTGGAVTVPSHHTPMSESLSTLLEFISRMELVFPVNGGQPSSLANAGDPPRVVLPSNGRGLPTPEALSIVLRQAQQLLSTHAVPALSHIAGRLEGERSFTDPAVRNQIQSDSVQVGRAMQHLGALFLELGRTMLTLRMRQNSAEASVSAGPAVYISPNGPNPIMVQPFPLQTSSLFSGHAAAQPNPGILVPVGLGDTPRNVNIHIHAGTSLAGVPSVGPRPNTGEVAQGGNQNETLGDSGPGPVLPVRSVIATAVPSRLPVGGSHILSAVLPSVPRTEPNNLTAASPAQASSIGNTVPGSSSNPTVAEMNARVRNFVRDMQGETLVPSGQSEGLNNRALAAVSSSDDGPGNRLQSPKDDESSSLTCKEEPAAVSVGGSCVAGEDTKQVVSDDSSRSSGSLDQSEGVKTVPLGLGLGGLQPRARRGRQERSQRKISDGPSGGAPTINQNQQAITSGQQVLQSLVARGSNLRTDENSFASRQLPPVSGQSTGTRSLASEASDGQFDAASMMSQVLNSPALNGLLAGVSEQAGIGSPDGLRSMLDQFTRNPSMMNTINQITQQVGGQDLGGMFSGMGRGQGGALDLSSMVQHMMPIVSQALSRGSPFAEPSRSMDAQSQQQFNESRTIRDNQNNQNFQIDLRQAAERIERRDPPGDVFRSVVENTATLYAKGSSSSEEELVDEICSNEDLVNEFMEMLRRDIRRRLQGDSSSTDKLLH